MAEHSFQEVMHQFDRMCNANSGCINCPLHQNDYYSDDECHIGAFVRHPEKIEQTVMQWAARHPEPVYPTWAEFLKDNNIIGVEYTPRASSTTSVSTSYIQTVRTEPAFYRPIPADIAEKLGLEPKEG